MLTGIYAPACDSTMNIRQDPVIGPLDLEVVKKKLLRSADTAHWSPQMLDAVDDLYREFLYLHLHYPHVDLVPSHEVDEMWHNHILFTEKYLEDCGRIFGHVFHHYPSLGDDADELATGYARTVELYELHFLHTPEDVLARARGGHAKDDGALRRIGDCKGCRGGACRGTAA